MSKNIFFFVLSLFTFSEALAHEVNPGTREVLSCTVNISASGVDVCAGKSVTLAASGGDTYTWNPGNLSSSSVAVSPAVTTVYTVSATNSVGCVASATIAVTAHPSPTLIVFGGTNPICAGNTDTLSAAGAQSFTWITTNTVAISSTVLVSEPIPGVYLYTLTGRDANGCQTDLIVPMNFLQNPAISVAASASSICSGTSATLNVSGANTYSWSNGSTTATVTVTPLSSQVYTVHGFGSNGCVASNTVFISVTPTPTLAVNNYTICQGSTVNIAASGAATYLWNTGSNLASIIVSPTTTTNYSVTGSNGSCTDSRTLTVSIGGAISVYISPPVPAVCSGKSLTLIASGAASYTWLPSGTGNSITVSPSATTSFTVSGSSGSCSATQSVSVIVNPNPVTTTSIVNVSCFNGADGKIIPQTTGGTAPYSYTYSTGSSVGLPAGSYSVTTTDSFGCASVNQVSISQPTVLTVTATSFSTSCPTSCDGSVNVTAAGGTPPYSYALIPSLPNGSLCSGNYTNVIVDSKGCVATVSASIAKGNGIVIVSANPVNPTCYACSNGSATALVSSSNGPFTYTWMPGYRYTNPATNLGQGCYTVTVSDNKGCTGSSTVCLSFDLGGIDQSLANGELSILPNPNNGVFTVLFKCEESREIEILDMLGKRLRVLDSRSASETIDLGSLSNGLYYLKVSSPSQDFVLKVVKN